MRQARWQRVALPPGNLGWLARRRDAAAAERTWPTSEEAFVLGTDLVANEAASAAPERLDLYAATWMVGTADRRPVLRRGR
jgi:hypothetical protein